MPSIPGRIAQLIMGSPQADSAKPRGDSVAPATEDTASERIDTPTTHVNFGDHDMITDLQLEDFASPPRQEGPATAFSAELEAVKRLNQVQATRIIELADSLEASKAEVATLTTALHSERAFLSQTRNILLLQIQKTQDSLDSAMNDLRKAQISTFKQSQTDWPSEDDSKVREDVAQIYRDVRTWAKANVDSAASCANKLSSADEKTRKMIMSRITKVANLSGVDEIESMKHTFLILAALLSEHLRALVFENPFFWLNDDPERPSCDALHSCFMAMAQTDPSEAHAWRAQITRFLFKNKEYRSQDQFVPSALMSQEYAECFCADITSFFLLDIGAVLMKDLEGKELEDRGSQLYTLVGRAILLQARLQTQRTFFSWTKAKGVLRTEFHISNPYLKADRLHKLDEDEDDTSLDGAKVRIVLNPAVFAHGNSQGENYDDRRIIAKAVVYLQEPNA